MDSYARTARLYPALLALFPVSVSFVVFFDPSEWFRSVLLLALAAGGHIVLMRVARNLGESSQAAWWRELGGNPTALRLRWSDAVHEDDHIDLHERVSSFTGVRLPTRTEEEADSAAALRVYTRAVARLRELTRDHAVYPRVWDELKNYGFARNSHGLKPIGLVISALSLTATLILISTGVRPGLDVDLWKLFVVGFVDLVVLLFWAFGASRKLMARESTRYATAILDAPGSSLPRG